MSGNIKDVKQADSHYKYDASNQASQLWQELSGRNDIEEVIG